MRKRILCFVMAAVFTAGMPSVVSAERIQGNKDWTVEFDGQKMNSNFDSGEMKSEIFRLLPGDTIELQVKLKNSASESTDWYMTNEILQSLEESQSRAEGGAYTYQLTYIDSTEQSTVLYSSETVGGENSGKGEEGLHQATASLEEHFYLDRLDAGESGSVHLAILLDGETQGNAYQDTLAKLTMNFAVEKVTKEITYQPGEKVTITKHQKNIVRTSPKTGDPTQILGFCGAALISGVLLLLWGIRTVKENKEEGEEQR